VIARVWSATSAPENAAAYADHLRTHVLANLKAVDGYAGAGLWERPVGDAVELVVVTYWRSLEAIRGFAGDEVDRAVVADEAAVLLTGFDDRVRHYELVVEDEVEGGSGVVGLQSD
jgi:heme-degrading monooxygenase HmoA